MAGTSANLEPHSLLSEFAADLYTATTDQLLTCIRHIEADGTRDRLPAEAILYGLRQVAEKKQRLGGESNSSIVAVLLLAQTKFSFNT